MNMIVLATKPKAQQQATVLLVATKTTPFCQPSKSTKLLFIQHHNDSKTLNVAISHANSNRNKPIKQAVCDRGYVGAKVVLGVNIGILSSAHCVNFGILV
jgi:hypothetical protein